MCFQIDEDHRLLCAIALACIVHQMIDCWSPSDKMPPKQYNDDDDDDDDDPDPDPDDDDDDDGDDYDKLLAIKR